MDNTQDITVTQSFLTRIDFYLIPKGSSQSIWLVACRLIQKAYLRGQQIFVYCNHLADAQLLDQLLWTFKDDSFIPHCLQSENIDMPQLVQIGFESLPADFNQPPDILLNLSSVIPPFIHQFKRIFEIVDHQEANKTLRRQHYRQYQQQGFDLYTHDIKN